MAVLQTDVTKEQVSWSELSEITQPNTEISPLQWTGRGRPQMLSDAGLASCISAGSIPCDSTGQINSAGKGLHSDFAVLVATVLYVHTCTQ